MENSIKKLLCSTIIAFVSIGVNFNTNARVTREVAEATLPYLMEAAGIPEDSREEKQGEESTNPTTQGKTPYYSSDKTKAILSMIYTDAGQREMVAWAKKGDFPESLREGGFTPSNLYYDGWLIEPLKDAGLGIDINTLVEHLKQGPLNNPYSMLSFAIQAIRNAYIGALFPCGPGTFSSYAAHSSRLGYCVLNDKTPVLDICSAIIKDSANIDCFTTEVKEIISHLREYHNVIDSKLANIIFILDICDTCEQVKDILTKTLGADNSRERNSTIDSAVAERRYNEYDHRPVSATSAGTGQRTGDCVETLYRHLINIAIQNDTNEPRQYNIKNLPEKLRTDYYGKLYASYISGNVLTIPKTETEAGKTELTCHGYWKEALVASLTDENKSTKKNQQTQTNKQISQANVSVIAEVLNRVSNVGMTQSASEVSTDRSPETTIQNALNTLAGNGERFIVYVNNPEDISLLGLPNEIDVLIIVDRLWKRTIKVGIWNEQHAEIVSIDPESVRSTQ